jgi:ribosome-associated protein
MSDAMVGSSTGAVSVEGAVAGVQPSVEDLVRVAARAAEDKLGKDTVVIDVGNVLAITEFFVITSAANDRQVKAVVDEVQHKLREAGGGRPLRVEGLEDASWVLLDYGAFVVHVFLDETRQFYELERLWRDMPRLTWEPTPRPAVPADHAR